MPAAFCSTQDVAAKAADMPLAEVRELAKKLSA